MKIYFDMDGTLVDLYGENEWLKDIINENARPFKNAKAIINLAVVAKLLNKIQKNGYEIGIITWTPKNATKTYNKAVAEAKIKWLKKHLPTVRWNEINIIPYGHTKNYYNTTEYDILFDDEIQNRTEWNGKAYNTNEIIRVLKTL